MKAIRMAAFLVAFITSACGAGTVSPTASTNPSAFASESASEPTATASPLGGGVILVHAVFDESQPEQLNVFAIDAGTGERTLLGTLPVRRSFGRVRPYTFQWSADRTHVLIADSSGTQTALADETDAARQIVFVRGGPEVVEGVLSPQGDRIARLLEGSTDLPGCLLCADAPAAVVILDLNGGSLRTIPLPDGTLGHGLVSWAPDGSAVVFTGCQPCNNAGAIASATSGNPGGTGSGGDWAKLTPTAVEHAHLFIVPVDGSPARTLLDLTEGMVGWPAWSPSGATIAFLRTVCPVDEHAPYCLHGTSGVVTLGVADGQETAVTEVTDANSGPTWSPDGRRISFSDDRGILVMDADGSYLAELSAGREPSWSPNGQWLVFSIYDAALETSEGPWIIAASGGEPRLLGPYGGWGW